MNANKNQVPQRVPPILNEQKSSNENDEEEDSSDEEDDFGGAMMWDDDEAYVPPPQIYVQEQEPLIEVNNMFAEEQRNSLVFSTEDLKQEYHRLKCVSKEWSRKDEADLRKTQTLAPADKAFEPQAVDSRKTLRQERRAINDMGKNLLRLSMDYNGNADGRKQSKNVIASVGNLKTAKMHE